MAAADWEMRVTAPELSERVPRRGSLDRRHPDRPRGRRPRRAIPSSSSACGRRPGPLATRMGDCDRLARGSPAGLAARGIGEGDVVAFQMPELLRGRHHVLRRRRCSAWCSCRSSTSTVRKRSATSSGSPARRRSSPPTGSATATSSTTSSAPRRRRRRSSSWSSTGADVPTGTVAFDDLVLEGADFAPTFPDPDAPAVVGYTSGTTVGPEGRDPHAPHAQRRDDPDDAHGAPAAAPDAHGCARRPRDRDAGRPARPDPARPARAPHRRVEPRHGPRRAASTSTSPPAAAPPTSSPRCSTPRSAPRSTTR